VYFETYYSHQLGSVAIDKNPTKIKAQELHMIGWTLIKTQRLMKFNLRTDAKPQMVKINAQLETGKMLEVEQLLKEFKDAFAWTYKDLKQIPLELAQHRIELDTTIPSAHQTKYSLNPNYAKQLNKILINC
jgi:hypothetical protein